MSSTHTILGQDNESQVATKGGEVATMGSKTATKKNDKVRCGEKWKDLKYIPTITIHLKSGLN